MNFVYYGQQELLSRKVSLRSLWRSLHSLQFACRAEGYRCLHPASDRRNDQKTESSKKTLHLQIPPEIEKERGRYLDAMVDSHKYNAEGRAVIFGEPDFIMQHCKALPGKWYHPGGYGDGSEMRTS